MTVAGRNRRFSGPPRPLFVAALLVLGSCASGGGSAGDDSTPDTTSTLSVATTDAPHATSTEPAAAEPAATEPVSTAVTTTEAATTIPVTDAAPTGPASGAIVQPAQPTSGPGGSDYEHADWRVSEGGAGVDAWYVFEPVGPQPATAPLAIVMHGYGEFAGYDTMYEFVRHTVRHGSIVIYPRWQTDLVVPCPGPFDIEPCIAAAVNGISGALDFLRSDPTRVQPDLDETSYFGFSFGGIITADLANRHVGLGLPTPRAIFFDDPHDGGLNGFDEPALDDSLAGIPPETLIECHSGAEGVVADPDRADGSCNSLFPMLGHIPAANKSLVMTEPDAHGQPALSSAHGVCAAPPGTADAYDWNFCWKTWDALRSAAIDGINRNFALGDSDEHRDLGTWSDGVPITSLKIQDSAPIRP